MSIVILNKGPYILCTYLIWVLDEDQDARVQEERSMILQGPHKVHVPIIH